jgi:DNA-binding protein H-NS
MAAHGGYIPRNSWLFLGQYGLEVDLLRDRNPVARNKLASMSVDALLKLRDDIEKVLQRKADQLRDQLSRLGGGERKRGRPSLLKGRKVAIKYRDRSGNTWAGRGAQPVWLREKLKAGAKLEDFAVHKNKVSLRNRRSAAGPSGK